MEQHSTVTVRVATLADFQFAEAISIEMAASAKARGTGIAFRTAAYLQAKMAEGKAVIAVDNQGQWAGYCYIEAWSHGDFVANSGLIVNPDFRRQNIATRIKTAIFQLSRTLYPNAKIFGLTTGLSVMKINSDLGYEPVTYSELTNDENFWAGCKSCVNFDILTAKQRTNCLCTAMLFDPAEEKKHLSAIAAPKNIPVQNERKKRTFKPNIHLFDRWLRFKKHVLLKKKKKKAPVLEQDL